MNQKHLIWIIPMILILGILLGIEFDVDTSPDNTHVKNRWDCEEGCLYAEWIIYGYNTLDKPSELYNDCSQVCWNGDSYFD